MHTIQWIGLIMVVGGLVGWVLLLRSIFDDLLR